ncbi:uncharacterized protein LY79DRAFT_228699 [Colletotrichum navitas]|uniref:Uncharacterized protein n=1 Tax=Colletotrichum navitas TaxID=681940 RepID=A0AAD8PZM6_9PEZI|nr:uncharacterized protein LY79DRAFT_228699 [Colletotrichum navitas]KAK1590067.1 hypothetical protein LY79DRAFT_228699 [Colletotrichum navitas]
MQHTIGGATACNQPIRPVFDWGWFLECHFLASRHSFPSVVSMPSSTFIAPWSFLLLKCPWQKPVHPHVALGRFERGWASAEGTIELALDNQPQVLTSFRLLPRPATPRMAPPGGKCRLVSVALHRADAIHRNQGAQTIQLSKFLPFLNSFPMQSVYVTRCETKEKDSYKTLLSH